MRQLAGFFIATVLMTWGARGLAANSCATVFFPDSSVVAMAVKKNNFTTSRTLFDYKDMLHKDFTSRLSRLAAHEHWVDLGAGKANAQVEFLKTFQGSSAAPLMTAVAYKLDRWFSPPKFQGRLEVKEGPFEMQETWAWAKADLVTDVFGVITYTHDLHTTLQKTFDLMNNGGELYIFTTHYTTRIEGAQGMMSLESFLTSIEGLQVEARFGALKVTKTSEFIRVPSLVLHKYVEDTPPGRVFRLSN